jgi:glycosyltransferase involved in cell wall biosynthesis
MRILLSNKFYYYKGGDAIHTLELEKLLRSKGHEVGVFAMQHPDNEPSDYAGYFPSEIDYTKRNLRNVKEQMFRPVFSGEVKRKFRDLLIDFNPDILHVHNIHSQLSPVILEEARKRNIPVVWTLHDFKLLCPRYDCQRDDKPCELCFTHKKYVVRYRCVKDSLGASMLAWAEARYWNREKLGRLTAHFICPSEFIRGKMISGGFDENKLSTIHNFLADDPYDPGLPGKADYYCYVGRLSREKGVETLLKAALDLPEHHLKMVGTGPLYDDLMKQYNYPHIEFCGHRDKSEVYEILSNAMFSVMPSECYENNPLAVIESLCLGTPVIGADAGGIPELITGDKNGVLFESGNQSDLADKIKHFTGNGTEKLSGRDIARQARERFSSQVYYDKLLRLYESLQ